MLMGTQWYLLFNIIAGAAAIIRFRTPVEDPKDSVVLFILLGLGITAVSYVVFAFADSVAVLFLSRLVQGIGGGTIGVVHAYDETLSRDDAFELVVQVNGKVRGRVTVAREAAEAAGKRSQCGRHGDHERLRRHLEVS